MSRTGPTNVLFEAGEHGDCDDAACVDLLGVDNPEGVDVLFVTFTKSARDRIESLKRHADAPPANVGIVTVDVGGSDGSGRIGGESGPAVRHISDPSDLTGVGIAVSEFLSAWHGNGNRPVVCFESVTALLQYVEANRVFQFLNEITSKFEQSGARAHFHITPAAHEGQVLSVLTSLFDDRVTAADLGHAPSEQNAVTGGPTDPNDPDDGDIDDAADADPDATPGQAAMGSTDDDSEADSGFVFAAGDAGATPGDDDGSEAADSTATATEPSETDEPSTATAETSEAGDDAPPDDPVDDSGADSGDATEQPSDDGDTERVETMETAPDPSGSTPESEPADLVSSVINGELEEPGAEDSPFEFPAAAEASPDDAGSEPEAGADTPDSTADQPNDAGESTEDSAGASAATNFGRQKRQSKRDPIERPQVQRPTDPTEDDGEYKSALFSRTTATVIGVVVMVALVSFLTAAVPMPAGAPITDAELDGTPTPEPATAAGTNGTQAQATPTQTGTATPAPTATATPEPTATATPEPTATATASSASSGDSTGSTDGSDSSDTTATATPEPTATATPEPTATPTPDDGSVTDAVDDTTDSTTDAIDDTTDSTTDAIDNTTDALL